LKNGLGKLVKYSSWVLGNYQSCHDDPVALDDQGGLRRGGCRRDQYYHHYQSISFTSYNHGFAPILQSCIGANHRKSFDHTTDWTDLKKKWVEDLKRAPGDEQFFQAEYGVGVVGVTPRV
jgi:hypothetical protein